MARRSGTPQESAGIIPARHKWLKNPVFWLKPAFETGIWRKRLPVEGNPIV
jgi:hypothetical protein